MDLLTNHAPTAYIMAHDEIAAQRPVLITDGTVTAKVEAVEMDDDSLKLITTYGNVWVDFDHFTGCMDDVDLYTGYGDIIFAPTGFFS